MHVFVNVDVIVHVLVDLAGFCFIANADKFTVGLEVFPEHEYLMTEAMSKVEWESGAALPVCCIPA